MGATIALQSVGLWHLQTQAVLESRGFSRLTGAKKLSLHRYLQSPCHTNKPSFLACVFNNGRRVIVNSSSASTATTATVSSDAADTVLDVGEIKQKCCKWRWRGQYSINYFVSSDADSSQTNPPLLLVHGFGASIPHWRR